MIIRSDGSFRWHGIEVLPYKESGTHFRAISRQTLLTGEGDLPVEFRYFEIAAGGHSTLERHEHRHAVMIVRGGGHVLVGDQVAPIGLHDLVQVPPMTWHQFRATGDGPLGFLCLVACDRDRPQRPTESDLEDLRSEPTVANFIRV